MTDFAFRWTCTCHPHDDRVQAVRSFRYDEAEARIRELEAAIDWVMNDAKYKAPEQVDAFMVGRWIATLYAARCPTAETDCVERSKDYVPSDAGEQ
jgi:hypothetical protein